MLENAPTASIQNVPRRHSAIASRSGSSRVPSALAWSSDKLQTLLSVYVRALFSTVEAPYYACRSELTSCCSSVRVYACRTNHGLYEVNHERSQCLALHHPHSSGNQRRSCCRGVGTLICNKPVWNRQTSLPSWRSRFGDTMATGSQCVHHWTTHYVDRFPCKSMFCVRGGNETNERDGICQGRDATAEDNMHQELEGHNDVPGTIVRHNTAGIQGGDELARTDAKRIESASASTIQLSCSYLPIASIQELSPRFWNST